MMRHGYKGAFEMAATVDYLYGYDATARIGEDWMYEQVTQAYVADPEVRKFFAASNFESDRTVNGSLSPVRNRRDLRWLSGERATTSIPDRLNSP